MSANGKSHIHGVLVMILSSVLFSVMSGLIKYGQTLRLDPFRMVLYRFAIGLALLGSLAMFRKIRLDFHRSWMLFARGFIGGIAVVLFYLTIYGLGMAKGTTINYSYPIFATIGGALFLKERVPAMSWVAVVACFIGIGLIATSGGPGDAAGAAADRALDLPLWAWYALAVAGALGAGTAVCLVKKLRETDSSYAIFYVQCAIGFWMVAVPASVTPAKIGYWGGAVLVIIGLVAAGAQITMTWAYGHTTVVSGSLLGMLAPVFNIPVGLLLFNEQISGRAVAGIFVVLASCAMVVTSASRAAARGGGAGGPSSATPPD